MLAYAPEYVVRVNLSVGTANLRSRGSMEEFGGQLSDRDGGTIETASGPARHVVFEITRESFAQGRLLAG